MKIFLFLFLLSFPVRFAQASDQLEMPFAFTDQSLQKLCKVSEDKCELWIEGVIEGVEFFHLLGTKAEKNMFCFSDFETDIRQIRVNLMDVVSRKKISGTSDHLAIFSLMTLLDEYRCE